MFSKYFFWKPGTQLQKSLAGLLRSLLYKTLEACPDLVPSVLPSKWRGAESMDWRVAAGLHITKTEIREAFHRLIAQKQLFKAHRFCFFIDGLDEFEGNHQDDYRTMTDLLQKWVAKSPEDMKLCVSSREYNVFLNAFSSTQRLRLQDLTRNDMLNYVRDKHDFSAIPNAQKYREPDIDLVEKSNGIFL